MKIAFVFPGQGSQAVGMAAGFADNAAAAAALSPPPMMVTAPLSARASRGSLQKALRRN